METAGVIVGRFPVDIVGRIPYIFIIEMGVTKMRLQLNEMGLTPAGYPKVFYRVSTWQTGRYVADFTNEADAKRFAIEDARDKNMRYDHKVSTIHLTAR